MSDLTPSPWYTNLNDLIGGYAIGTEEGPVSGGRCRDDIADMMNHENAERIVSLHNAEAVIRQLIAAAEGCQRCGSGTEHLDPRDRPDMPWCNVCWDHALLPSGLRRALAAIPASLRETP